MVTVATAQLVCASVFAHVKSRFSHYATQNFSRPGTYMVSLTGRKMSISFKCHCIFVIREIMIAIFLRILTRFEIMWLIEHAEMAA